MENTLEVKLEHLEASAFVNGLHYYADRSNNHRIRLEIAKIVRQAEKKMKEPFKEYQDLLRVYGKKNREGNLEVIPGNLSVEEADAWEEKISAWRERSIILESDLFKEGKIEVKLPAEDMDKLPYFCYGALLDYADFVVDAKKGEVENLRDRVGQLEAQLKVAKKEGSSKE